MLDIMAFIDQKDSGSVIYYAGFDGDNAPRAVFLSFLSSGPVARHHGRYGPDGQLRGEIFADMVPMVHTADNCGVSAVAVLPGRRHLFCGAEVQYALSGRCPHCAGRAGSPARPSPFRRGSELLNMVAEVPVVQVELVSWCRREGDSRDLTAAAVEKSLAPGGSGSSPWWSWVDGDFFKALHTGAGPGVVSTGTRPP